MADKLTSKPVTPSEEMLTLLKEWVAPDVTEVKKELEKGKTNFMGTPLEQLYSKVEEIEEEQEEEVKPLTAEEIEQIRQDAYNEGFAQGNAEGYQKGHELGLQDGHQQGLEQGTEQGFEAGLKQGQEQIELKVVQWQNLLEQLYKPISKVDAVVEQQLLNLAVMLAESVIRIETAQNQQALLQVLQEAISYLPFNTEYAELHLHPSDIELLTEVYDEESLQEKKWIIKEEPGYRPGDLVVATPNSLIDRSIKQRIKQSIEQFVNKAELDKELNEPLQPENNLAQMQQEITDKYQQSADSEQIQATETNQNPASALDNQTEQSLPEPQSSELQSGNEAPDE